MRTIAIAIHKGGTGKSTITFNLGHALAAAGLHVLLVDLDYQGSLSNMAGCPEQMGRNITQVMTGALPLRNVIVELRPHLAIAPADIELAEAEPMLANKIGRENILRRALATVASSYDVCLVDCPPALGLMTINALAAADGVLIPLQPTSVDVRACDLFLGTIGDVHAQINPGLALIGLVLTFFDQRYNAHTETAQALAGAGLPVIGTIGRSVKVAEAAGAHVPIGEYERDNPQTSTMQLLAEVLLKWLNVPHLQP